MRVCAQSYVPKARLKPRPTSCYLQKVQVKFVFFCRRINGVPVITVSDTAVWYTGQPLLLSPSASSFRSTDTLNTPLYPEQTHGRNSHQYVRSRQTISSHTGRGCHCFPMRHQLGAWRRRSPKQPDLLSLWYPYPGLQTPLTGPFSTVLIVEPTKRLFMVLFGVDCCPDNTL